MAGRGSLSRALWGIYLKYEYLGMDTWEEIEEILAVYVREHITERG